MSFLMSIEKFLTLLRLDVWGSANIIIQKLPIIKNKGIVYIFSQLHTC